MVDKITTPAVILMSGKPVKLTAVSGRPMTWWAQIPKEKD